MQREFLLFSDSLLWLAPIKSHSRDWDWSRSGISQNSASTTNSKITPAEMIRTRSKSEAEISSLKDDDLSPGAESFPVSPQKLDRHKSHFQAVPPPPPNMDWLMINLSTRDELNLLILGWLLVLLLRTRGGLRCRVLKAVLLCMLVRTTCHIFYSIFEIDSHFSNRRRKRWLDFWNQRSQDSIICFFKCDQSQLDPWLLHCLQTTSVTLCKPFLTILWSTRHFTCQAAAIWMWLVIC